MSFDWTTFLLEIVNFLVLVWILKRFLYSPALAVLDARRQRLQDEAAAAARLRQEAAELKTAYDSRLADWSHERELQRQGLEEELAQARAAGTEELRRSLAEAEASAHARADALAASREAALIREAAAAAYGAAAAMLRRMASADLSRRIAELFAEDLAALPDADLASLRRAATALDAGATVDLACAHELDQATRDRIASALSDAAGKPLATAFRVDPLLISGLRAGVGECLLHANLADELAFFRQGGHD